jgi:hypothetical protein
VALGGFEGVDVRARGGYVIAPPSRHISGRSYFFTREDVPIAKAPSWLEELLTPPERPVVGSYKGDKTAAEWLAWAIDRQGWAIAISWGLFWLAGCGTAV